MGHLLHARGWQVLPQQQRLHVCNGRFALRPGETDCAVVAQEGTNCISAHAMRAGRVAVHTRYALVNVDTHCDACAAVANRAGRAGKAARRVGALRQRVTCSGLTLINVRGACRAVPPWLARALERWDAHTAVRAWAFRARVCIRVGRWAGRVAAALALSHWRAYITTEQHVANPALNTT